MNHIEDTSQVRAQTAVEAAEEMKAVNVVLMDVHDRSSVTDYLVICSGTSDTHIKSIAEKIQDEMRLQRNSRAKPQGDVESLWLVLDYGDVIVHVFDDQTREFYDLERLWSPTLRRNPETVPKEDA